MFQLDDGPRQGFSADNMIILLFSIYQSKYRAENQECHQSQNQQKQNIIKGQKYLQSQILELIFNILLLPNKRKTNKVTNHLDILHSQFNSDKLSPLYLLLQIYSHKLSSLYLRQDQDPPRILYSLAIQVSGVDCNEMYRKIILLLWRRPQSLNRPPAVRCNEPTVLFFM